MTHDSIRIGLVSISDRASSGTYEDKGLPALEAWFGDVLANPAEFVTRLIPDEQPLIEATLAIAHKVLPGFGEAMRAVSLKYVPTAILSRQVGVTRGASLILNLPGQPKAIKETLDGIFAAVPYCIDLIGGPYLEARPDTIAVFRPKSAQRPSS